MGAKQGEEAEIKTLRGRGLKSKNKMKAITLFKGLKESNTSSCDLT